MSRRSEYAMPQSRWPKLGPGDMQKLHHAIELTDAVNTAVSGISSPLTKAVTQLLYEAQQEIMAVRDSYLRRLAIWQSEQVPPAEEEPHGDGTPEAV